MLFRWLRGDSDELAEAPSASGELVQLVRATVPAATADTAAIVGAVAGLLAVVAYADRTYHGAEREAMREALARVHGLPADAGEAVAALLEARMKELASEPVHLFTRVLYERTDRSARLELLDVLMDLAAADDVLSMDETHVVRRIAKLLGLSDDDYLAAQAQHRGRLSVLRP